MRIFLAILGTITTALLSLSIGLMPSAAVGPAQADEGGAVLIASDAGTTCALLNANQVKCWGANGSGQLGNGTDEQEKRDSRCCCSDERHWCLEQHHKFVRGR